MELMKDQAEHAELYLNGKLVGRVTIRGGDHSWSFGEFTPNEAFAEFATLFGLWSLLMHADEDADRLTSAASDELRAIEIQIDRIRAKMRIEETGEWRPINQINIDGELIDWKT